MAYSKQARERNILRWWLAEDDEKVRTRVIARIKNLRAAAHARREMFYRFADLYGTSIRYAHRPEKAGYKLSRLTYNYLKSYLDTWVSQICKGKVLPQVATTGGTAEDERRAESLNLFFEALFDRCGVFEEDPVVTRDAGCFGTGMVYVGEEFDQPFIKRVLCTEVDFDEFEWRNGKGRTFYWSVPMDRSLLCELFEDCEEAINNAPPAAIDDRDQGEVDGMTTHDLITVRYAWHLRSGPKADDGRFGLFIDAAGGTLMNEEYEYDDLPFAFLHCTKPLAGFMGESIVEQMAPGQLEIEFMAARLQEEANLGLVSQLIVREGSTVNVQKFNNQSFSILSVKEPSDVQQFATSYNPGIIPYIQFNKESMSQVSTVSPMAAMGQQPTGITAARALQLMDDQESERKIVPQLNRERFYVQVAKLLKRVCENIGSFKLGAKDKKGQMIELDLSEVNIDDKQLVYSIMPTNFAAKNASARVQQADDLMKLGSLQPENVNRFLGIPDVERESILLNARRDFIAKTLEDIVYKGEYEGPDPMMDLSMARKMAGDYYALAKRLQVDESRVQMIRDFAVECDKLPQIGTQQQNLATIQPGMQPVAGLPGAPPAPGGPPPGAMPMNGAPPPNG
jgi:hypothetical protein